MADIVLSRLRSGSYATRNVASLSGGSLPSQVSKANSTPSTPADTFSYRVGALHEGLALRTASSWGKTSLANLGSPIEPGGGDDHAQRQSTNTDSQHSSDTEMHDVVDVVRNSGSPQRDELEIGLSSEEISSLSESDNESSIHSDQEMIDISGKPDEYTGPPQPDLGIPMLDRYAFNFNCVAYDCRVPREFTIGITLNVSRINTPTVSLAQHRTDAEETGEMDTCPPLLPLKEETNAQSTKPIECVWVGMLPSQTVANQGSSSLIPSFPVVDGLENKVVRETSRKSPKKKVKNASIMDLTEDNMSIIPFDPNALRVVAKKSGKCTKSWYVYALVNPNPYTRLCEGYKVGLDDVYFFRAFRSDDAKTFMPRKHATQDKIKAMIFPSLPAPAGAFSLPGPSTRVGINAGADEQTRLPPSVKNNAMENLQSPYKPNSLHTYPGQAAGRDKLADDPITIAQSDKHSTKQITQASASQRANTTKSQEKGYNHVEAAMMKEIIKAGGLIDLDDQTTTGCSEGLVSNIGGDSSPTDTNKELRDVEAMELSDADSSSKSHESTPASNSDQGNAVEEDREYPEHAVAADDPDWDIYRNDLISQFHDHEISDTEMNGAGASKAPKSKGKAVHFQCENGQVVDNHGKVATADNTDSSSSHGYDGDDEDDIESDSVVRRQAADLAKKMTQMANHLAADMDISTLRQGLAMLTCLKTRKRAAQTSALGLYLNVPTDEDVNQDINMDELFVSPYTAAQPPGTLLVLLNLLVLVSFLYDTKLISSFSFSFFTRISFLSYVKKLVMTNTSWIG